MISNALQLILLSLGPIVFSLVTPSNLIGQDLENINIRLTIKEKLGTEMKPLPNAKINIAEFGNLVTDENGENVFTYPIKSQEDCEMSIVLLSGEHKTLRPLDGAVALDPTKEEMRIELLVVNMANESEKFKKRIGDLERRMANLKVKNQLSQQQINALGLQLVDTILYYENLRVGLEDEIQRLDAVSEEQKSEIASKNERIARLEERIEGLTEELAIAKEEQFLRQKKIFDNVSAGLRSYVRKTEDIRDHMPFIKSYFSSPGGLNNYGGDLKKYNQLYENLDDNRAGYLEGIENYWESKKVLKDVEELFEFTLRTIHMEQMKPPLDQIYQYFLEQKPKKAQKVADQAYENMKINLRSLQQMINRVESRMRNDL